MPLPPSAVPTRPRSSAPTSGAPPWWWLLLPIVASALLRGLWAPDEPRRAEVALEMWQLGDPWVLHLCGEPYPDKPPLFYWITALLGALGGWHEAVLRIVSLAATGATAALVARIARERLDPRAATWAPCLFLGFALIAFEGGRLNIDPLLMALCTAALTAALLGTGPPLRRAATIGLWTGLGALAKGPVAFSNVGLVLLAWWLTAPRPRPRLRPGPLAAGVLLAVVPVTAWAGVVAWLEPGIGRELFFGQHVGRVLRAEEHPGPLHQNLLRVPLLLLPWTPLVVLGIVRCWRTRQRGLVEAGLWFAVHLAFFSVVPVKRDLYLMPMYPAAALLGAAGLVAALDGVGRVGWLRVPGTVVLVLVGAALLGAAPFAGRLEPRADLALPAAATGAVLFAGGLFAWRAVDLASWTRRLALGWAGGLTLAGLLVLPALDPLKSARDLAEELAALPQDPTSIPCLGVHPEGYRFYGGVPAVRDDDLKGALERDGREFVGLVREREWQDLEQQERARFRILLRQDVGSKSVIVLGAPDAVTDTR